MAKFIITILMLTLAGCVTQQTRAFDPDLCNHNAAYEAGYNDGLNSWFVMDSQFLNRCREDLREQAQLGYRDGFGKGREEMAKRQEAYQRDEALRLQAERQRQDAERAEQSRRDEEERERQSHTPVIIGGPMGGGMGSGMGGGGIGMVGSGTGPMPSQRWYCRGEAFMDKYEGFGPSQFEARREATNRCKEKHHEMHCGDMKCEIIQ